MNNEQLIARNNFWIENRIDNINELKKNIEALELDIKELEKQNKELGEN